jgi:flagellar protein FliS
MGDEWMSFVNMRDALQQYRKVGLQSSVENADDHQLIQLLMQNVLTKIASAKGHMQRGEIAPKGEQIGRAISIVEGLRANLDHEKGGDIALNLDRLYEYMGRRLLEANARNDLGILDEVYQLMQGVKQGWDEIGTKPALKKEEIDSDDTTSH